MKILATINKYSNNLVASKSKDETAGVAIEKFAGLQPKKYRYLVDGNSEPEKGKGCKQKCFWGNKS